MATRPRISISMSPLDVQLERASIIFLLLLWSLALYAFIKLPAIIPTHFNASGRADQLGSKWFLLIEPVLGTIIYLSLSKLNSYPHVFNYMTEITEDNAARQYGMATKMLRFLKLASLLILCLIVLFTYLTSMGVTNGVGFWFLPVAMAISLLPLLISIVQSIKK